MGKLNRTMILAILTVLCIIGTAVSEVFDLDNTIVTCFIGFISFGMATLFSAFTD